MLSAIKQTNSAYRFAVLLSFFSVIFGIGREFLIVGLLGFSAKNDELQIYLSIFYSISLSIDAIRLAGLNLCGKLPITHILLSASIVAAVFTIGIGLLMSYLTGGLNQVLLGVTILGSFLNLITVLIITYKQRFGAFLSTQIINVLPNFVLIPGILLAYFSLRTHVVFYIISLCCLIPLVQLFLLAFIQVEAPVEAHRQRPTFLASLLVFIRHGASMLGEQLFQLFTRAMFFKLGHGYLSVLAMTVRIYAAARFILIDSYIGSKLAHWGKEIHASDFYLDKILKTSVLHYLFLIISIGLLFISEKSLLAFAVQIITMLVFSFYFNALVRIIYFKINRYEHDASLVVRFGLYELIFSLVGFALSKYYGLPIILFLWIWYVAKPCAQLLLLRPKFFRLMPIFD
jgi:hypothetical protein